MIPRTLKTASAARTLACAAAAIIVASCLRFGSTEKRMTSELHKMQRGRDAGKERYGGPARDHGRPTRLPDVVLQDGREPTNISQIVLLGERNSGTKWTTTHLRECFEHALPVKVTLVRHKHWFQSDILRDRRVNETLVVAQFRNPCQWAEAMRTKNYHAPMHRNVKKDWKAFVTTPWTMPRIEHDLALLEKHQRENRGAAVNESAISCQKNFTYNRINACVHVPYVEGDVLKKRASNNENGFSSQEPFYEHMDDGSGRAYPSLMDMRSDKIRNHLSVHEWDWVAAVLPIQYEEMVRDGTARLIANVEGLTGVRANCTPFPPQNRPPRVLSDDMVEWMTKYVDWNTEALIGYEKC